MTKEYVAPKSVLINFDIIDVVTDDMSGYTNDGDRPGVTPGWGEGEYSNPFANLTIDDFKDEEITQ